MLVEYCRTSKLDTLVAWTFKNLVVMIVGIYYLVRVLLLLSISKFLSVESRAIHFECYLTLKWPLSVHSVIYHPDGANSSYQ